MSDSLQIFEPGTHCTACRQLNRLKSDLSKSFSWSKCLLGSSAGFCVFQATGLVSESSLWLHWSKPSLRLGFAPLSGWDFQLLVLTLAGRSLVNSVSFKNFLKLLSSLPSCLRSFPEGWHISIWEETIAQQKGPGI